METDRKRILLIDDEVMLTHLLKVNLERTGAYEVRVENRGADALEAARAFHPDLIFLDVIMPDIDGGQVAAAIQADPVVGRTPIVFLTAVVTKMETKTPARAIGGQIFVAKPVNTDDIVACIEKYAGTRRGALNPAGG